MLRTVSVKIIGISPLLLHNGQMANPLNPFSKALKEISAKRKKTDSDYEKMSDIEWRASLYVNEENQVLVPGAYIEGTICNGSKLSKLGRQSKSAIFCEQDPILGYDGPKDIKTLEANLNFRDIRAVRIGTAKIMRTRPIFRKWDLSFDLNFDDGIMQFAQVQKSLEDAGQLVGIGDFRPKYGRFQVEKFELLKK